MPKTMLSGEATSWSFAGMETFLKVHCPDTQHLAHEYVFSNLAHISEEGLLVHYDIWIYCNRLAPWRKIIAEIFRHIISSASQLRSKILLGRSPRH